MQKVKTLVFIVTLSKSKMKLLLIISVLCFAVASVVLLLYAFNNKQQSKQNSVYEFDVENNEDRVNFLRSFGWEIDQSPVKVSDITVPVEFNETYQRYNDIQKAQELDLSAYKGQVCKLYTYKVNNYPAQSKNVYADMLIADGRVVGGDICSNELGGFMHGFSFPDISKESNVATDTNKYQVERSTERQTLAPDPEMPNAPTD